MELKRTFANLFAVVTTLLIVPYGIETYLVSAHVTNLWLLIVPYGIETYFRS